MTLKVASKLERSWGTKPCNHPKLEKVFYFGTYTEVYACTQCGKQFSPVKIKSIKIKDKIKLIWEKIVMPKECY
jgi:hypothetical protein